MDRVVTRNRKKWTWGSNPDCPERTPATPEQLELFNKNTRLVHYALIRRGIRQDHHAYQDLAQEGMIILMRAALAFKPELGFRFSTYAVNSLWRALERVIGKESRRGFAGTAAKTIENSSVMVDMESTPFDSLPTYNPSTHEDQTTGEEKLQKLLAQLSKRDRYVVECRYLNKEKLQDIAVKLGIGKERVRQLQMRGIKRMQETADRLGWGMEDFAGIGESPMSNKLQFVLGSGKHRRMHRPGSDNVQHSE